MSITTTIKPSWSHYDQTVAKMQLLNYNVIFLDSYGCPIDNEYELEDLYTRFLSK